MVKLMAHPNATNEADFPGPSRCIWRDFPQAAVYGNPFLAGGKADQHVRFAYDNFYGFGPTAAVATNVGRYKSGCPTGPMYYSYEDSGGSIVSVASEEIGMARLSTDSTDNDEVSMQCGSATAVMAQFTNSISAGYQAWFEVMFRKSQVASGNMFLGLAEEGSAISDFIGDTGVLADKDFMGFYIAEGAATTLTFTYKCNGQTVQVPITSVGTIAAATWYKAGFRFVPNGTPGYDANKVVEVFLSCAASSTYLTSTNLAAATFPAGEEMSPIFAIQNSAGTATNLDLRFWGFGQRQATS